jgi:feruloyl esterase
MKTAAGIALLGAVTLGTLNAAAPLPIACESLAQTKVANGRVLSAEPVGAGAFTPPNAANANAAAAFNTVPAFCRVTLQLTPSSDSDIRVEVWLPKVGWNHKLQASGNGGLGGAIPYPALAASVKAGYAAVGTDTGHVGGNADFVPGHPEKLVDFGHRAIHEMTVTAKTIVTAHYDARPMRAYFSSCSTGGRQALIEAQRYPDDFDEGPHWPYRATVRAASSINPIGPFVRSTRRAASYHNGA